MSRASIPADGARIVEMAANAAFGAPLITNVLRGLVAEAIVSESLGSGWTWCSSDYSGWDFEHENGARLEVKQSASRQSWATPTSGPSACSFDIKPRKGRWEGAVWIEEPGRAAGIYVFGHHPVEGSEADHREPKQWRFYVIAAKDLPQTQRISLKSVQARSPAYRAFAELGAAVEITLTLALGPPVKQQA